MKLVYKLSNIYVKYKCIINFIWKYFGNILPKTIGVKYGIKSALSNNPNKVIKGSLLLGILLTKEFKRRIDFEGYSQKEIIKEFNTFLKNKK